MFGFTQHATDFAKWGHIMKTMQEFLLVKEVARILGVSPNTVRTWADSGKLPEHRHPVNRYRLFRAKDVEKLRRLIQSPACESTKGRRRKPK
jgi:excisionase family DNA binding protein